MRKTKNLPEITMKSTIFNNKSHNKFLLPGQLATKLIVTGTKDKTIILPGLGPEKVEKHCCFRSLKTTTVIVKPLSK